MKARKKVNRQNKRPSKVKAFGNLDHDQQYPITQDAIDRGMYVLLHYSNIKEPNPNNPQQPTDTGILDPRTYQFGVYTPSTYHEYVREDETTGKVNTFNKMKDKYIVIHDPSLDEDEESFEDNEDGNGGDKSGDDLMQNSKVELIEMLKASGATLEEVDAAEKPAFKKAQVIELINKYKQS